MATIGQLTVALNANTQALEAGLQKGVDLTKAATEKMSAAIESVGSKLSGAISGAADLASKFGATGAAEQITSIGGKIASVTGAVGTLAGGVKGVFGNLLSVGGAMRALAVVGRGVLGVMSGPAGWAGLAISIGGAALGFRYLTSEANKATAAATATAKVIADINWKPGLVIPTATGDPAKMLEQLTMLKTQLDFLRKGVGPGAVLAGALEPWLVKNVDGLAFFQAEIGKTERAVFALRNALVQIAQSRDLLGDERADKMTAAITDKIAALTGSTDLLRRLQEETAKASGKFNEMEDALAKMAAAGELPKRLDEIRAAFEELEKAKILQGDKNLADSIKKSLITPLEEYEQKIKDINRLEGKGLLTPEQAIAARAKEAEKLPGAPKTTPDSGPTHGPGIALKDSAASISAILSAARESDAAKQLAAQEEANKLLAKIAEKDGGAGGGNTKLKVVTF